MRIVLDLQGAQTESRFRGIGRYSMSFAKALVRNRGDHEVVLALSGLFPDTIKPIRAEFDDLLPQQNICVWHAPGPTRESEFGNNGRRDATELIRESFLASLQPDVVHITSLFEGYVDDAVTSIGRFDKVTPVSVSLYDLIPLVNPEHYLKSMPSYEKYYLRKVGQLQRASLLLSISESSRLEAIDQLALGAETIVNVGTAVDANFRPLTIGASQECALRDKFGLTRSIVLYTGGDDERKNLPGLINAYAGLSSELRDTHQLAIAGKVSGSNVQQYRNDAQAAGMGPDELLFTGYVTDDELIDLYNLCKVLVCPSWHEGFGLPVLEAMSCGRAAIAASTSSLPEVIGLQDALFDPKDEAAIAKKITRVLTDDNFRVRLEQHGLEQAKKFSWDNTAMQTIAAFEEVHQDSRLVTIGRTEMRRPKVAYISPLPPERSGISDYSAELIPELSRHYEIDVIVAQKDVSNSWINANCHIRSVDWFRAHADDYERVLYQFGNSPYHQHMFSLLIEIPGVVVLHDFYLSAVVAYMDRQGFTANGWASELYKSHGYGALREFLNAEDQADVIVKYPCNISVLQAAQGVIVHSEFSRRLGQDCYSSGVSDQWEVIPLLRVPAIDNDHARARNALGLDVNDFVICSFGLLDETKLNHRLLESWLDSTLSEDSNCMLIFVGENHGGEYGQEMRNTIQNSGLAARIRITGWTEATTFRQYLAAADVGVQLRTQSRGETSAAVLDCMNFGLATIVNAHGSNDLLPNEVAWKLPDEFDSSHLIEALETLWREPGLRMQLGNKAREFILNEHAPQTCADRYFEAIEGFYRGAQNGKNALVESVVKLDHAQSTDAEYLAIAESIARNFPERPSTRRLFIDVTATSRHDLKTGIERVARALLLELIKAPPAGYRIEPVYLSNTLGQWQYRYARSYTLGLLGCQQDLFQDEVVVPQNGDLLLGVDMSGQMLVEAHEEGLFDAFKNSGVAIYFVIYDLLPILSPQFFPPGADSSHAKWLHTIAQFDGAMCISQTVAGELSNWIESRSSERLRPFQIGWFPLGADIEGSDRKIDPSKDSELELTHMTDRPTFLMVGTIEPRKGHLHALDAFTRLWRDGEDVCLVIVGKEGWKELPDEMRRTVPEIVMKLRNHPEFGQRLVWLEDVNDEYLNRLYAAATCFITASEGEGFGLPLIEAARYGLPIIARDLPVFREVAGDYALYFDDVRNTELTDCVREFLASATNGTSIRSSQLPNSSTWKDSAEALHSTLIQGKWARVMASSSVREQAIDSHLDLIHEARVHMVSTLLPSARFVLDLGGANAPLYRMGYPYQFDKLVLIDLPPEDRHEYYQDISLESESDNGEVVIKYNDMTQLGDFQDESVDLVWSGQSIEHVTPDAGKRMCEAAYRVLKPGGAFCLDTPNRLVTEIHTRDVGGGFIHPEHCVEYTPAKLKRMLLEAGFSVKHEYGICEMPQTVDTGNFCYEDFIYGEKVTDDIEKGYILYYHCVK